MPAVFQTPDSPAPAGQTRIRGFAGKGAFFEGVHGIGIQDITDGTSNTILVASARDPVPWTKPADLPFIEGEPLPALDGSDPRGYALGMADGSVRLLPRSEERLLRPLITRAGGEVDRVAGLRSSRRDRRLSGDVKAHSGADRHSLCRPYPTHRPGSTRPAPAPAPAATPRRPVVP